MPPRDRSYYQSEPKGTEGRFGTTGGGFDVWRDRGTASDQTGEGDCAPFSVMRQHIEGGRINQPFTSFFASYFADYRADIFDSPNNFAGHLDLPESPNDVFIGTSVAARTNPSRPTVDVAANVLELGSLTGLIKEKGLKLIKEFFQDVHFRDLARLKRLGRIAGDINLEYKFGIAPIVGDIVKICDFQSAFTQRAKQIMKLRTSRGFRKTVDFGVYEASSTSTEVLQSVDKFITGQMTKHTTQVVRSHIRWVTDEDLNHLIPDADMARLVRRSIVNFNPLEASALWEAVPWSWLIDWGYNVGTYFKATRNVIPCHLDGVHVMRHTKTTYKTEQIQFDNVTVSPSEVTFETKTRNPTFVFPSAQIPFLSGSQMGILASLAITRS